MGAAVSPISRKNSRSWNEQRADGFLSSFGISRTETSQLVRFYKCSSCANTFISDEWHSYCPHCGAHGWSTDKVFFFKCSGCGRIFMGDDVDQTCPFCGGSGWKAEDFAFFRCGRCGKYFVGDGLNERCSFCGGSGWRQ